MTDTPADLDAWVAKLAAALQLPDDVEIDVPAVLDLARDAAHGVARPAAPLTTFLVGLAAGLGGASPDDLARSFETARQLAAAEQA